MITDEERRNVAERLRLKRKEMDNEEPPLGSGLASFVYLSRIARAVKLGEDGELFYRLADLIDRPTCHDLVEHKQDPFIPGKRMVDGYFHCSDCGWDGQIWEHIGFGDMLAYEAVHCPKCGAIIERRA